MATLCGEQVHKCHVTKGLLLHVDAPVKQFILAENKKHNNAIVVSDLCNDETKIFVNANFEDAFGEEWDTVDWLQVPYIYTYI